MNDTFSRFKRILLTYFGEGAVFKCHSNPPALSPVKSFGTVVKLLALSVVVSFGFLSFISEKGVF
jgi:hypothetical protein